MADRTCAQCGHLNRDIIFEPVLMPVSAVVPVNVSLEHQKPEQDMRWSCDKCGRYHWPDGRLYFFRKNEDD